MKRHGIERQTLAVALIPILVLALSLEGFFTYTRFSDMDRALFDRAKLIVRQLASASEYPVFSGNQALLQQQVEIAFAQPDVDSVIVRDADRKFLAGAGSSEQSEMRKQMFSGDDGGRMVAMHEEHDALWLYHPIVATQIRLDDLAEHPAAGISNEPMGGVIIKISKQRLNREKAEMLWINLSLLVFVVVTTMMIAARVSQRITRPVLKMSQLVRRIGEGHLDVKIPAARVLELDALATGINDMVRQLQLDRSDLEQRIEEATQELRRKKDEAEKANFDKSRFLAAASHDLRQPMHALGLFVGELRSRLVTPEQIKIANKMEESVEALSSLLDSLLDISKLDAGVVIPQVQTVDIEMMMQRLVNDFVPVAERKQIRLRTHCAGGNVLSDPVLLERILLNLLGNAIRYTPQGGSVLLSCRLRGDMLRIEVRDNGIGIPLEEQQNIFREFVQLSNSARDRSKGIGLGLAIVDRLARLLHHPLTVRSAPGRGSTFAILVPRMLGVAELLAEPGREQVEPLQRPDVFEQLKVLVVDDDTLVRTSTAGILQSWGCEVEMSENYRDAAQRCSQQTFDLVLCDYRLPDGDGLQLADRFVVQGSPSPDFILISGDTAPEILQAVNERGLHLLHKPVRPAKLRSLILFLLKRRKESA
jgi:signal transduction histidine kinase/ActR/RegA family two-component response regulator